MSALLQLCGVRPTGSIHRLFEVMMQRPDHQYFPALLNMLMRSQAAEVYALLLKHALACAACTISCRALKNRPQARQHLSDFCNHQV